MRPIGNVYLFAYLHCVGALCHAGEIACRQATIVEPNAAVIADVRPTIVWSQLDGATRYRIRVESRVPEGLILESIDTIVDGLSFRVPTRLAWSEARVKVIVTEVCDRSVSIDRGIGFIVDATQNCRWDSDSIVEAANAMTWSRPEHVLEFEVRIHRMPDGELLSEMRTSGREVKIDVPLVRDYVVAVRPLCANGSGHFVYKAGASRAAR